MNWLKAVYHRLNGTDTDNQHVEQDHYALLELLCRNHDWIDVTVTKSERSYQSLILAVDTENGELVIDQLYPQEGLRGLASGDTLAITSRSKRLQVNFFTRILSREGSGDDTRYRLELPQEIGRNQSRNAYRVYVENEQGLDLELQGEDGQAPITTAHIINLSSEGIKLSVDGDHSEALKHQQFGNDSLLLLPDGQAIDCDIQFTHVYPMQKPQLHTLAGGKLIIHQPQQRVKLQQYLAAVQRRQRRREIREE